MSVSFAGMLIGTKTYIPNWWIDDNLATVANVINESATTRGIYFAFVTTTPTELDSPAAVTLYAATFADVVNLAAQPIAEVRARNCRRRRIAGQTVFRMPPSWRYPGDG